MLKQDGQFSVLFAKCDSSPGRDVMILLMFTL